MKKNYEKLHAATVMSLILVLLIVTFLNDNPFIQASVLLFILVVFKTSGNIGGFKKGFFYFVPFSVTALVINMIFSTEGRTIIFSFLGRNFTLEALIYSILLSIKLLIVIYLFMMMNIMIDSDKAAAYFLSKMPKSTLTVLIGFKLIPGMRERLKHLKEVYSLRGVEFDGRTLKQKTAAYVPILSILLEDSLESAFNIGEAAYIRGFLSGKRSVYDKQAFGYGDYAIFGCCLLILAAYIIEKMLNLLQFDVYSNMTLESIFNTGSIVIFLLLVCLTFITLILTKEN